MVFKSTSENEMWNSHWFNQLLNLLGNVQKIPALEFSTSITDQRVLHWRPADFLNNIAFPGA